MEKDFFYVCPGHLKDNKFCTPIVDPAAVAARRKAEMDREVERVKREYEEKQRRKKEKEAEREAEREKEKEKDSDKKDKKSEDDTKKPEVAKVSHARPISFYSTWKSTKFTLSTERRVTAHPLRRRAPSLRFAKVSPKDELFFLKTCKLMVNAGLSSNYESKRNAAPNKQSDNGSDSTTPIYFLKSRRGFLERDLLHVVCSVTRPIQLVKIPPCQPRYLPQ